MNEPSRTELVHVVYIRATPRALWNALTQASFTRQYYVGLELKAELKRGGRFDYMNRAELHGRPGAGVEGAVIGIGRASCRERGKISGVAVSLKKKKKIKRADLAQDRTTIREC